jgi:hypothetical protein
MEIISFRYYLLRLSGWNAEVNEQLPKEALMCYLVSIHILTPGTGTIKYLPGTKTQRVLFCYFLDDRFQVSGSRNLKS